MSSPTFVNSPAFKLPNSPRPPALSRLQRPRIVCVAAPRVQAPEAPTKHGLSNIVIVDPFSEPPPKRMSHVPRPVIILPGYGADANTYRPMARLLEAELGPGASVTIAPVRGSTWIHTFGGRPVTPILEILDTAVRDTLQTTGADSVTLVAHSAGGWISRIYLGDAPYPEIDGDVWAGSKLVHSLVCLGTPHRSVEPVAYKNMSFVNGTYPGAYHRDVRYINFAGDGGSVGNAEFGAGWMFWKRDWFPRLSYHITDSSTKGKAVDGDGIVPVTSAFLEDADKNIRLNGVWHSPDSRGPWYGHPQVVSYWSRFLK